MMNPQVARWMGVGLLAAGLALAQQQNIPDAPSATRPPQPKAPVAAGPPSSTDESGKMPPPDSGPPSPPGMATVPAGKATPSPSGRDDIYTLRTDVSMVVVPVTVKDGDGHLVDGLLRRDFRIYEDDVEQNIRFFTSDPFPLSAAVVIDQGMSSVAMKKVNETLPALLGAFSQYDEVALLTYASNVTREADFGAAGENLTRAMQRAKRPGRTGGVPVVGGPMQSGPSVNSHPLDPGAPHVHTVVPESHVLNDAILAAALELSKRDVARRRIIFVISDGREEGSSATYRDVLKVLLSHEIAVYALGVDAAAIPVYDRLSKLRLPGQGYGNILDKYVNATGGGLFTEFSRDAMEAAYARITEVARNQYTLAYSTRATAAGNYRRIEVRVERPGLKVYARDGYYPLPLRQR